jgi:hypothetical protein
MTDIVDPLEEKGWLAVEYLRSTDKKHADMQAEAKRCEHRYKKTVDVHFLALEGSIELRKAKARIESEPLYLDYMDYQAKADEIYNKRDTAQRTIDYVRTIMANRRMG